MEKWEAVDALGFHRLKIFGGWLVKRNESFTLTVPGKLIGTKEALPVNGMLAMVFVPDPNHEWTIAGLDKNN